MIIEKGYGKVVRPFLLEIAGNDPERLHNVFLAALHFLGGRKRLSWMIENFACRDLALEQELWGLKFKNPVGLAAGFDKNGFGLLGAAMLGIGFEEIGTITPYAQIGFPRPRIFYFPKDKALINRMGFPNDGTDAAVNLLAKIKKDVSIPIGINIGKGMNTSIDKAIEDYIFCLRKLYLVGDYFVANVSCPHMPGLQKLRERDNLDNLLVSLKEEIARRGDEIGIEKPLLVKIPPDNAREELNELLDICIERQIDGIVAVNTTLSRSGLSVLANKEGGMSGKPLFGKAVSDVKYVYDFTKGKIPIMGVGGISDALGAYEMLAAGASLVQIYTGFVYQIYKGPYFFYEINKGILGLMRQNKVKSISGIKKRGGRK